MRIRTLAYANLMRRRGKAAFLAGSIAIGIGTVVALLTLSGSIRSEIGAQMDQFGANIAVLPRSESLALNYGGIAVSSISFGDHTLTNDDARQIPRIPLGHRIAVVAPKLLGVATVDGRQFVVAGVDFANELRLKRWWRISGTAPKASSDVLVGSEAAEALGLLAHPSGHGTRPEAPPAEANPHHAAVQETLGELVRNRVTIAGQEHEVTGVLTATGGPEDRMIFAALEHVQTLLGQPDRLSLIEVSALCKDCPVQDIVAQIGAQLPHAKAVAVQQSVRAREEAVERLTRFSAAVSAIVLVIGALLVFTTMTGSVLERTREIGVMRAIGFRRSHIMQSLLIEVAVISLTGGVIGWAAGTAASAAVLPYSAETATALEFRPALAAVAVASALLLGTLSGLYPILRAARLDPAEAVRYV